MLRERTIAIHLSTVFIIRKSGIGNAIFGEKLQSASNRTFRRSAVDIMDRNTSYQILRNDDEESSDHEEEACSTSEGQEGPEADGGLQEASREQEDASVMETDPADAAVTLMEPPSYIIATSLPTYEEAEENKEADEQFRQQKERENQQAQSSSATGSQQRIGDVYLGTDGIFICSFLLAFLFNCIGLFAILCVSQTIAARFGAISGFGLSIVKYVALMKYQNWVTSWTEGYSWLWWFTLFLGLLMFFRGSLQYMRIKHQWSRLSQQTRGRIYLYF